VAPFTVLVDPVRALKVLRRSEWVGLSERATYIYRMQQQEAGAIAISKIDLLEPSERDRVEQLLREQFPDRDILGFSARSGEGFGTLCSWLESGGARGRVLHDLDYGLYAEGEAAMGWLNSRLQLAAGEPMAIDEVLLRLGQDIHDACRARGLEIAHGKLLLKGNGCAAVVNMVDNRVAPELSRPSGASASAVELTINVRVQGEPLAIDEVVQSGIASWAKRHDITVVARSSRCLTPPPPVPTHRMTAE
jgi:hypothetical protein